MKPRGISRLARLLIILCLTCLPLLGAPGGASAATIVYVKYNATGANNGTSWRDAYKSLSTALKWAPSGAQIWVAKGTYSPTTRTDPLDPRTATFTLRNNIAIYGGFRGIETLRKQRKPRANLTILTGNPNSIDPADGDYHVVTSGATNATAVLDGFEITRGYANGGVSLNNGGGMYISGGSPTLRNLSFIHNYASGAGGGLYNENASPTMVNIVFSFNHAGSSGLGGGLYNYQGNLSLTNAIFSNNSAVSGGGMADFSMPGLSMTNVTFYANQATSYGGGLYNAYSTATITNATFESNSAGVQGGAIYNYSGQVMVSESILWNDGSELQNDGAGAGATITDAILQGSCPSGTGCLGTSAANPVLESPAYHGGFVPTQALAGGSSAIDAGGVNASCAAADARGVKRPQGPACDLGAYEVNVGTFKSVGSLDGQVTESNQTSSVGRAVNSTSTTFHVGDSMNNQQVKGILSFKTGALPDSAAVVSARVDLTLQSIGGSGPSMWTSHGDLELDAARPYFGSSAALEAKDFESVPAHLLSPATFMSAVPVVNVFHSYEFQFINLMGTTQVRLYWTIPDDNDAEADYWAFYSGDALMSQRPRLVIYYNP